MGEGKEEERVKCSQVTSTSQSKGLGRPQHGGAKRDFELCTLWAAQHPQPPPPRVKHSAQDSQGEPVGKAVPSKQGKEGRPRGPSERLGGRSWAQEEQQSFQNEMDISRAKRSGQEQQHIYTPSSARGHPRDAGRESRLFLSPGGQAKDKCPPQPPCGAAFPGSIKGPRPHHTNQARREENKTGEGRGL